MKSSKDILIKKSPSERFIDVEIAGLIAHMNRLHTGITSGLCKPAEDKDYQALALNLYRLSCELKVFLEAKMEVHK